MDFEIITKLPRKENDKRNTYDWDKIINSKIIVNYENEIYNLIIHKKEGQNLFVSLYGKLDDIVKIHCTNFLSGHIGKILGNINYNYIYNKEDIIKTKTGEIKILEQIKIGKSKVRGYRYECLIDGNIDTIDEDGLCNRNQGCNVCSNHKVVKGINDIATTHPHLTQYFKNIEDTYKYSFGSGKKLWLKCPNCGFEKYMEISNLSTYEYFSCPKCGDEIPMPQKTMFNVLEQLQINFETEKIFDWCKYFFKNKYRQGRYDFYFELNNKKYIIETDGDWHNKDNKRSGQTAEESKFIDDEKDRLAQEYNIEVIRIDCELSDFEYIKQNILQSKLSKMYNLDNIDWIKVLNFVKSSRIIEACNYYNKSLSFIETQNKMKITYPTLIKYLKIGKKLNLCEYKTQYELGQEHFMQVINLWNNGMKSTRKIADELNMHYTSVINILKKAKKQNLCDYVPILGYQTRKVINN